MEATSYLTSLGVYGFDKVEAVVLAALVTEDPLLLVGRSGTGKTFLLNSLSEALGLEHRHYNASLISFDDLVGFPYPDQENGSVRFLQTPATVWQAESVLIDEISRCKPEHQNRLFSLIHERKVQGLPLDRLRFRWAAMNPCEANGTDEDYSGSEPLDPALADRFGLFVTAGEWDALGAEDQRRLVDPAGEGKVSIDSNHLKDHLKAWRLAFLKRLDSCPPLILDYAALAVTHLNTAQVRVSPRRARMLSRSLLAASIVRDKLVEPLFLQVLRCSLPQPTWGASLAREKVLAAHQAAWNEANQTRDAWLHSFLAAGPLEKKLELLLTRCSDPDQGSQAIAQLLASEPRERAAAFAFAVFPAAVAKKFPLGSEGINDLAKVAGPMLKVDGEVSWQEPRNQKESSHPDLSRYAQILGGLKGARAQRAKQFFLWCLVEKVVPAHPVQLEQELEACVALLRSR